MNWRERISVDPKVCHGTPCIKGTRIMVWLIVDLVANADTPAQILKAHPSLKKEDIQAALHFAAEMTKERVIPLSAAMPLP